MRVLAISSDAISQLYMLLHAVSGCVSEIRRGFRGSNNRWHSSSKPADQIRGCYHARNMANRDTLHFRQCHSPDTNLANRSQAREDLFREGETLSRLRHPNIIKLVALVMSADRSSIYLVQEKCNKNLRYRASAILCSRKIAAPSSQGRGRSQWI